MKASPALAVCGDDQSLVAQAERKLVSEIAAAGDPPAVAETYGAEDLDVIGLVGACRTPPFFATRRLVVLREVGRLRQDQVGALADYLENPLETTSLVLVAGGGQFPPKLLAAVKRMGEVVDANVGRDRASWLSSLVAAAGLQLGPRARERLLSHIGEDLGRASGLIETLAASYGEGARVGVEELEPFLGEAGSVPPWSLTDAIDAGETPRAVAMLHRMLGDRHPLVVMAVLHRHYASMLRLDGVPVSSPQDAAEVLGARSSFTAGKSLAALRRLGTTEVGYAFSLLAAADMDLRGETGWPPELVLEVLVARLSRLGRQARPRRPAQRPSRSRGARTARN